MSVNIAAFYGTSAREIIYRNSLDPSPKAECCTWKGYEKISRDIILENYILGQMTINPAAFCASTDDITGPLDAIYNNFLDAVLELTDVDDDEGWEAVNRTTLNYFYNCGLPEPNQDGEEEETIEDQQGDNEEQPEEQNEDGNDEQPEEQNEDGAESTGSITIFIERGEALQNFHVIENKDTIANMDDLDEITFGAIERGFGTTDVTLEFFHRNMITGRVQVLNPDTQWVKFLRSLNEIVIRFNF